MKTGKNIRGTGFPGLRSKSLLFRLLLVIVVFAAGACKREQLDDCFTRTGPQTSEERQTGYYERIELYNNVNLVLVPGNQSYLKVEGGKNLLSAVKTDIADSTLTIRNTMKCNWIRNYNREITVYATAPALKEIRYEGSGDVRTDGSLAIDTLSLNIRGGAGSFNLDLNANVLNLAMHYGTVDLTVKGSAIMTTMFANSYGPFYCGDLKSHIVFIRNSGSNDCYIHAEHVLGAEITSVGNIYYTGNPFDLSSTITGSGKLIKLD